MYTLRLFTKGWIIYKDGDELFCGFGDKEIALAVAREESIYLSEIVTDDQKVAA